MSYKRFEDALVWQEAIRLAEECEDFLIAAKELIAFSKRNQHDRCSLSVSNNIAEGFEQGTTNQLLAFLYIAPGSAREVRSMLCFFERQPAFRDFAFQISNLKSIAETCPQPISAWADFLQNSNIKGQRHLDEKSHPDWQKDVKYKANKGKAEDFERQRMASMSPTHPKRVA